MSIISNLKGWVGNVIPSRRGPVAAATEPPLKPAPSAKSKVIVEAPLRTRADLQRFVDALRLAEDPRRPQRYSLVEIYRNTALMTEVAACINARKLKVLSTPPVVTWWHGKRNTQAEALLRQPWARKVMSEFLDALFWGYSVMQLQPDGSGIKVIPLNRESLEPREGLLLNRPGGVPILSYRTAKLSHNIVEAVAPDDDLGLLAYVVKPFIFHRDAEEDWADFIQRYGIPPIVYKAKSFDDANLDKKEDYIQRYGASSYVIVEMGDDIDMLETTKTDAYKVFDQFLVQNKMSINKLLLGSVPATAATLTYANVSDAVDIDVVNADRQWLEQVMNAELLPLFRHLDGCSISIPRASKMSPSDRMELYVKANSMGLMPDAHAVSEEFGLVFAEQRPPMQHY